MATAIGKDTNIEAEMEKTNKLRNIFGYTSNKFWRVVLVTLATYNNMILNNDTLRDKNGLNEKFANLEWIELNAVKKAVKTSDKKDVEKANKIIAKKVSTLNNFMDKYDEWVITDKKTGLVSGVLELLSRDAGSTVDNSKELKAKDIVIEKGNDRIAELEAELEATKKAVKEEKVKAPKGAKTKAEIKEEADWVKWNTWTPWDNWTESTWEDSPFDD